MVDSLGFVGAARAKGMDPKGMRALLVDAGGAGSAIALELVEAEVRELAIHDSDAERRDALIGRLNGLGCVITKPDISPFIAAVRKLGCVTGTGTDMYLQQQSIMVDFLLGTGEEG